MFDRRALASIPEPLWPIMLPQLDMLDGAPLPVSLGFAARFDHPTHAGWVWGCAIAADCLLMSMHLRILKPIELAQESAVSYGALCHMSTDDLQQMERQWEAADDGFALGRFRRDSADEHVLSFAVAPGRYRFPLQAGSVHEGTGIYVLPSWLERAEKRYPHSAPALEGLFTRRTPLDDALELKSTLRSITPLQAAHPAAGPFYEAKVKEALSLAVMHLLEDNGHFPNGTSVAAHLTNDAGGSVSDHVVQALAGSLAEPPSLDELASWLYMGKTALCQRFRQETGMSVGQMLARLRTEEAKRLMAAGLSMKEVSQRVGFRHQSSFSALFKRQTGMTPAQWKSRTR